MNMQAFDH